MSTLANLIRAIHYGIIAVILLPPIFSNNERTLNASLTASAYVIFTWITNGNACNLTTMESRLRGIDREEGFIYGILSGIAKIKESEFNIFLYIFMIVWTIFTYIRLKRIAPNYRIF